MKKNKIRLHSFLRWTEKYLKTDMVYLAKGGFWLTVGQIFSMASIFLLSIAYANFLSAETYGVYKYVISIYSILAIFTVSGLSTPVMQAAAQDKDGTYKQALKTRISWGLLGSASSILLAFYYWHGGHWNMATAFFLMAIFIPFTESFSLYDSVLQGKMDLRRSTIYSSIAQSTAAIIAIITIWLTGSLYAVILSYFIPWTLFRIFFTWLTDKRYKKNDVIDEHSIAYGKHLTLMNVLPLIAQYLDRILIFNYLSPASLAVYSFAIAIPDQIKSLAKGAQAIIIPKYSKQQEIDKKALKRHMLKAMIILILATIAYIIVAPYIYKIFFPAYVSAVKYSIIYSLSIAAMIFILPLSAMQTKRVGRELYQYNLLRSLLQVVILVFLTYEFGLLGAIWAKVISEFINLGLLWLFA